MAERYWDDFEVGEQVATDGITITESHLVQWAGLTMDFYPLHLDKEYAAESPFGERIAHGPLIFALANGLLVSTGYFRYTPGAWLGVDNMKIPLPVMIGDTITVLAEMIELRETKHPDRGVAKMHFRVLNQRHDEVMSFDMNYFMERRG